jgi:hypothetical protein
MLKDKFVFLMKSFSVVMMTFLRGRGRGRSAGGGGQWVGEKGGSGGRGKVL